MIWKTWYQIVDNREKSRSTHLKNVSTNHLAIYINTAKDIFQFFSVFFERFQIIPTSTEIKWA